MTVRRLPPLLLALVLGLLAALAVACGEERDDRRLLAPTRAEAIKEELDTIDQRVERGNCDELAPAFIRLRRAVDGLPARTDRRLRRTLSDGVENLERVARDDCRKNRPETTQTTETEPEIPETVPPETTPTETVPPETTPTETVPPETTPPETTPPDPIPPDGTGGEPAPGEANFVPPGQAKKDGR